MRVDLAPVRLVLKQWWARRSGRERSLLAGMALVGGLGAVHAGLVQPLAASRAEARARIAEADQGLALLASLPAGRPAGARQTDAPASALLTETAAAFGLAILRIEPEGAGASLLLADAEFARMVGWIEAVEREGGLALTRVEIERRPEPGLVGAALSFGRP